MIQKDGFRFNVQIVRKGSEGYKPCRFTVTQLSQFNRAYICNTDVAWQEEKGMPGHRLDLEGVKIRVFTDRIAPKKEIPENAIFLRVLPPEIAAKEDQKVGLAQ